MEYPEEQSAMLRPFLSVLPVSEPELDSPAHSQNKHMPVLAHIEETVGVAEAVGVAAWPALVVVFSRRVGHDS